jgi:ribosomal protein S3AE
MNFVFYDSSFPVWRNIVGIAAATFVVPIVIVIKLILMPFERATERSASEVAEHLRDFINDTGSQFDFDDFISCEIKDPALEGLRQRAMELQLPVQREEIDLWINLLSEAEALAVSGRGNDS